MCGATKYGTLNHLPVVLIWAKGIMDFSLTTINVLMLVALAIPGYILVKTKLVKPSVTAAFSVVLLYVNQPFLTLYSFIEIEYSQQLLANLGITFLISLLSQFLVFLVLWLIFKKKFNVPILQLKGLKAIDKNAEYYERDGFIFVESEVSEDAYNGRNRHCDVMVFEIEE